MATPITRRIYNRFDIAGASPQPDGNVVLDATDTFTNSPVQIFQWTPTAEGVARCAERLTTFDGDDGCEIFSDEFSLYLALPASADPVPMLSRLREQQLFLGAWSAIGGVIATPVPAETTFVDAEAIEDDDGRQPVEDVAPQSPPRSRIGMGIGIAVVVLAVLIAAVIGIQSYNQRIEEERARAAVAQQQLDEANKKAADAEAAKKQLEAELAKQAEEKRQLEAQAAAAAAAAVAEPPPAVEEFLPPIAGPIQLPGNPMTGLFFVSLARSNSIRQQKLLAFAGRDATYAYFQNDADWKPGRMAMTSVTTAASDTTAASEKVLVVLSDRGSQVQQTFLNQDAFPLDWIKKQWAEKYHLTTVSRVGSSWWVVMTKGSDFDQQVVLGPVAEWPAADIKKQYDRRDASMFITDIAHRDGQGFVVVMSSTPSGRLRKQRWYSGWNQPQIDSSLKEGYRFPQAVRVGDVWYVVLTDTGEDATWQFNEKEFPRDAVGRLGTQGYRIGWVW